MTVVDTNIIAYLFIPGDCSAAVERLYKKDSNWVAPGLWKDEFINILCTYERAGELSFTECLELIENAEALMFEKSFQIASHRVLAVAHRTQCSGYDSQFISLSEDLGVKLFTYDKKILDVYPESLKPV